MKKMIFVTLMSISLSMPILARAQGGGSGHTGGGGDAKTEMRIDEIRGDLLKWINEGGAKELKMPENLALNAYETTMKRLLERMKVVVTAINTSEENASDEELNVSVDGQPKL